MMDERESSTASSVDFYGDERTSNTPAKDIQNGAPAKRKIEELAPIPEKKRKLDSPSPTSCAPRSCAGLPAAAWQHVFLYCSLQDLGRLLQVNRIFHSYLTDVRNVSLRDPQLGSLRLLKSESLWASARNALPVKPPKPFQGFSELQMWQLAWAKRCQFCGEVSSAQSGEKFWQEGPGARGVRTIWPFGIVSCGTCLLERCKTDASLLFSNASALRPALPFAFITKDHHYIPASSLQAATTPANVEIAKYYYKQHVDDITQELEEALGLGTAAAEEWSKGLEARGNERMKLVDLWERWQVKYQSWSDQQVKRLVSAEPSAATSLIQPRTPPMHQIHTPVIHAPIPATTLHHFTHPRPPTVPQQYTPHPTPGGTLHSSRGERNIHDANETKASRKADIERRCQRMDPTIPPNVLRHMDSFKAALQISRPMTDDDWNLLQPRLLAQLPAAQQAEIDHVSRHATLPRTTDRRHPEGHSKETKEVLDREWEEQQRPVRDELNAIADDFINQDWARGTAVTYENSPKFAADTLVYVRRVFYANATAEEDPPSQVQPNRPNLVLESMKWVYDNKVKPLTEQFRKELFLCYGNGCEGNYRFYGFEGVIQHFGAKHTNAFSVGNVVVAWREAEWPEDPPFHPDPISVKHAYHAAPSASSHTGYGAYFGGYSRAGTSTPHVQSHLPQASPGPYHYGGHYSGPFAPPHMASAATPSYDYGQPYGRPVDSYQYQSTASSGYGPQAGIGYLTSPVMSGMAIAPPPNHPALPGTTNTVDVPDKTSHRSNLFDKQVSTIIEVAKDIWKQTSGIKDLPNSLRIYVLLQRIISKFQIEFNHEPTLDHIIDAFSTQDVPQELKKAPGLSCKACQGEPSLSSLREERKVYNALDLLSHFQSLHTGSLASIHGNGYPPSSWDWKESMIELPGDRFISGLIHAPGMDDAKLHMVATVFPSLFPLPLPKIGIIEAHERASPAQSILKDSKSAPRPGGTSGDSTDRPGPPSLDSPYKGSPRPLEPEEDSYDPDRPGLHTQANPPAKVHQRKVSYRGSPPTDRRPRYYTEARYYLPEEYLADDDHARPREYLEYAPSPRRMREPIPYHEEYPERIPIYREQGLYYHPSHDEPVYRSSREDARRQEYMPSSRHARFAEDDGPHYRYERALRSRDPSPYGDKSAADQFLDDFVPGRPPTNESGSLAGAPQVPEPEGDAGPHYSPPPPGIPPMDRSAPPPFPGPIHPKAPSTVSNGSRYEEHRPGGRQAPTPNPGRGTRRPGPHRRRDRYQDQVPARYSRYMSVAREEPYSRGASMSRSQSKRYEQQRRRINQQETPQPNGDQDPALSRDQSVERLGADEAAYPARQLPPEYVSVQDRLHPSYSPPRYRYNAYEEPRGPAPLYVDEYGRHVEDYEIIRVPRERGPYLQQPPARYIEHNDNVRYVPVSYGRAAPQRYEDRRDRTYIQRQPAARGSAFEPEDGYEPPPEIKLEQQASVPEGP